MRRREFVTLLGEEIIPTYSNQNYNESHSYIFGFGIPFTHTGIRAQTPLSGLSPFVSAFPNTMMSGVTPKFSIAQNFPAR